MTNSEIGMIARDTTNLATEIFPGEVSKYNLYYYFWVGICLVWLLANRYLPRSSKENVLSITITGNVICSHLIDNTLDNHNMLKYFVMIY